MSILTQERLKELLTYDPETGLFHWLKRGKRAGCLAQNGYIYIRDCDQSQNMCNAKKRRNSASPFKGIYLHKASGLWHARVQKSGHTYSLGYFSSPQAAAARRDQAASTLHGEFARLNEAA